MPHTLAAWLGSLTSTTGYGSLTALSDAFFATSGNAQMPPRDVLLLAAMCGGSGLLRARLEAPGLLRVAYPQISPIQAATTTATDTPRVCDFSRRPIRLTGGEPLTMTAVNGGAASTMGLVVVGFDMAPVPAGEAFFLRYSASGLLLTAGAWNTVSQADAAPLTYETSLPSGTYALMGIDLIGATAIAVRAVLPGYRYRPGAPARTSATAATYDSMFMDGRNGVLGYFTNWQMPSIEVLPGGADTSFEGVMRIIRIGGPELLPSAR